MQKSILRFFIFHFGQEILQEDFAFVVQVDHSHDLSLLVLVQVVAACSVYQKMGQINAKVLV